MAARLSRGLARFLSGLTGKTFDTHLLEQNYKMLKRRATPGRLLHLNAKRAIFFNKKDGTYEIIKTTVPRAAQKRSEPFKGLSVAYSRSTHDCP